MRTQIILFMIGLFAVTTLFQNCSDVSFQEKQGAALGSEDDVAAAQGDDDAVAGLDSDGDDDPSVIIDDGAGICNPLDPSEDCDDAPMGSGLLGKLYYLTPEVHASLITGNSLRNAVIDDYRNLGVQVPVNIKMTSIDVTPRSWENGFYITATEKVKKESGEELFEWFHLDMSGFISLPAGSYQFATLSDDGMRVTVNGEVLINADGIHSPRYDCASKMVQFNEGEKKHIRVQYFQGPRTQISMQLLVRSASLKNKACGDGEGLESIPPSVYSLN